MGGKDKSVLAILGFGVVTLYTMRDVSRALHEGYRDWCGLPRELLNSLNGKSLTHINAPCGQERVFVQKVTRGELL